MADTKLHVLYIPGLGDTRLTGQRLLIRTWKLWGVSGEVLQMNWSDNEAWDPKLQRILCRVDELSDRGVPVAVVAASAGASAALNAFALRKPELVGCVLIAGKVNRPGAIGTSYQQRNPAFVQSALDCQQALLTLSDQDRSRIQSRYGIVDGVVPKKDSYIPGAHNKTVLAFGHSATIATQLLFGAPYFLHFLKDLAKKVPAE